MFVHGCWPFLTAAEGAGQQPPPACTSYQRGEEASDAKDHQSMSVFNTISDVTEADASSLLRQKSPQQCQVALPSGLKHMKMPFVAGMVKFDL